MLRALAIALTTVAAVLMGVAIKGIVTGRPGGTAAWAVRAGALACFATAVVLAASR